MSDTDRYTFRATYIHPTERTHYAEFTADTWEQALYRQGDHPNWPGGDYELTTLTIIRERKRGTLEMTPISDPRD